MTVHCRTEEQMDDACSSCDSDWSSHFGELNTVIYCEWIICFSLCCYINSSYAQFSQKWIVLIYLLFNICQPGQGCNDDSKVGGGDLGAKNTEVQCQRRLRARCQRQRGLGEHRKLPQWGPGGTPAKIEFCTIWMPKKPSGGTYCTEVSQ